MNQYDSSMPFAYSPGEKFSYIQDTRREETIGGLTTVFRRMINLFDENSPLASRYTITGEQLTYFQFLDFNAMYPGCMRKKMPLTAGIEWILSQVGHFILTM